jgi:hypothetical protein
MIHESSVAQYRHGAGRCHEPSIYIKPNSNSVFLTYSHIYIQHMCLLYYIHHIAMGQEEFEPSPADTNMYHNNRHNYTI